MSVKLVVLGAGGYVGARLVEQLLKQSELRTPRGDLKIAQVLLVDQNELQQVPQDERVKVAVGDLCDPTFLASVLTADGATEVATIQLAALLSGYSEDNFDLAMKVNLQMPITVMDRLRVLGDELGAPQVYVFVSSDYVACFNEYNKTHPVTEESYRLSPVSYGVQKACVELLLCDYSRKGFVDGRVVRLSAVIGRPGWSNSISYPYTGIFTQTLEGKTYDVPLPMNVLYPISSMANNVASLLHAVGVQGDAMGHNRVIQLPAKSVTLADIWTAAQSVAKARGLPIGEIREVAGGEGTTTVKEINVCPRVDCSKAENLGFPMNTDLETIISDYCDRHLA